MERISIIPLTGLTILLFWSAANTYLAWFRPDMVRRHNRREERPAKVTKRMLGYFVHWGASDLTLWYTRLVGPIATIALLAMLVWILLKTVGMWR